MSPNSGPTPRPWHPCRKQPKPCRSTSQTPAHWVVNFTLPRQPMELLVSSGKLELDKAVLREMRTGVWVIDQHKTLPQVCPAHLMEMV